MAASSKKKGWKMYTIQAPRGVRIKVIAKQLKVKRVVVEPRVGFRPICEHGLPTDLEG